MLYNNEIYFEPMLPTYFKIIVAGALSVIPALLWGYVFLHKQPERKWDVIRLFIAGGVSVAPLLLYKYLWTFFPWINAFMYASVFSDNILNFANVVAIPLSVIMTFMIVGVIEELAKFAAVKMVHHKAMNSVTDSIEFFIIAGLGFAFVENIIYFTNIMQSRGLDGVLLPFIFRSLFSTFAHLMFSGILGYFYGTAQFATPIMHEKYNRKKWTVLRSVSKLIGWKKEILFHHEQIFKGILTAISLHAVFNVMLEMNWTFLIVPYLTVGFLILSYCFENKRIDKDYYFVEN